MTQTRIPIPVLRDRASVIGLPTLCFRCRMPGARSRVADFRFSSQVILFLFAETPSSGIGSTVSGFGNVVLRNPALDIRNHQLRESMGDRRFRFVVGRLPSPAATVVFVSNPCSFAPDVTATAVHSHTSVPIRLERIDSARNMARYYTLAVEVTLFDDFACTREFGRIGSRGGRIMIGLFESAAEAEAELHALLRTKQARGYRMASG